jgi:IS4 transposase
MRQTDFAKERFSFSEEFDGIDFGDRRLNRRLVKVMENLMKKPTGVIQKSQNSWTEMMGAYRFFSNENVSFEEMQRAHFEQTIARMSEHDQVIVIQDTSRINFSSHPATKGLGSIAMGQCGWGQGILLHSTLAVTKEGVPLGLLKQEMWARGILKKRDRLYESERIRWLDGINTSSAANFTKVICVGDREADGADFYAQAKRDGVSFVIRGKSESRKTEDPFDERLLVEKLRDQPPLGSATIGIRHRAGRGVKSSTRLAKLKFYSCQVQLRKQGSTTWLTPPATPEERLVNAVLVEEEGTRKNVEPIKWLLFTDLPAESFEQVFDIIKIYRVRWEIENFHKILKSCCEVEKSQLEDAKKLKKLISALSIVAWRLHVLVKLQRERPDALATEILSEQEWKTLYIMIHKSKRFPKNPPSLREATLWIAKLGNFIGRKSDGEPGPLIMARGWQKLIHYTDALQAVRDVYN